MKLYFLPVLEAMKAEADPLEVLPVFLKYSAAGIPGIHETIKAGYYIRFIANMPL